MANDQETSETHPNWAGTPTMDSKDFHSEGGQSWKYDGSGVCLQNDPATPLRSDGPPTTVNAILAAYGGEICKASIAHQVPPELIVMTIATETAIFRKVSFTGPKTFRWEPTPV